IGRARPAPMRLPGVLTTPAGAGRRPGYWSKNMPFTASCSACGFTKSVPEAYVGKKVRCPKCGHQFRVMAPTESTPLDVLPADCIPDVLPVEDPDLVQPTSCINHLANGEIVIHARNVEEAKLGIKVLRAKKKELTLAKRANMQQQREIRA